MLPPLHPPPLPSPRLPLLRPPSAADAPDAPGEAVDAAGDARGVRLAPPRSFARPDGLRIRDVCYRVHLDAVGSWDRDGFLFPWDSVARNRFLDGVFLPEPKGDLRQEFLCSFLQFFVKNETKVNFLAESIRALVIKKVQFRIYLTVDLVFSCSA